MPEGFPHHLSPPAATMGCCCSSDYDEDWIENIDICEHCNYPIEPDSKPQVGGSEQIPRPHTDGQTPPELAKPQEGESSRGSSSLGRG